MSADKLRVTLRSAGNPSGSKVLEIDSSATVEDVRLAAGLDGEWYFAAGKGEPLVREDQPLGEILAQESELYAARRATKG
jgi:hypothetical protein